MYRRADLMFYDSTTRARDERFGLESFAGRFRWGESGQR